MRCLARVLALVLVCACPASTSSQAPGLDGPTRQALLGLSKTPFAHGQVLVVPSSHQDIAWMDTPQQCAVDRDRAVITPALRLLAEHPDYRIVFEAAYMLDEYLSRHPDRRAEIARYVRQGRLGWGATYVEPYESSYSGESLIRGLYFGRRWLSRVLPGYDSACAWNPDVPARSLQMQQILAKAGVRYLVISRQEKGLYRWLSPDGSSVVAWSPGHYVDFMGSVAGRPFGDAARSIVSQANWWLRYFPGAGTPVLPFMATTDMSGPQTFYRLMAEWNGLSGRSTDGDVLQLPAFRHATDREILDAVMAGRPTLPAICGERPNVWLYIHGPTHHWALSAAREAAILLTTAEKLSTVQALLEGSFRGYPQAELSAAWKSQIHPDHGWGGNHGDVTDEVFRADYERARDAGKRLCGRAVAAIARRVKTDGRLGIPVVVFNALSWRRSDPVEVDAPDAGTRGASWQVVDQAGRPVPSQLAVAAAPAEVNVALSRMGSRATASSSYGPHYGAANAIDGRWGVRETDKWNTATGASGPHWLVVDFGRARSICRVVVRHEGVRGAFNEEERYNTSDYRLQRADTAAGPWTDLVPPVQGNRAVLTTHRFAAQRFRYLRLYITKGSQQDNEYARIYEVEAYEQAPAPRARLVFVARDVPSVGYRTFYLRRARPAQRTAGPRDSLSSPFYRIGLCRGGIRQIRDLRRARDLLRTDRFAGGECFTMQSVGNGAGEFAEVQQPTMEGFDRFSVHAGTWRLVESGPVRSTYACEGDMPHVRIRQTVTLYRATPRIDLGVDLLGWDGAKYREFRMALPLALEESKVAYQVPFGTVEVGKDELRGAAGERYVQPCRDVRPREVQDWIGAWDAGVGVTMASDVAVCDYVDPTSPGAVRYPVLQPVLLASRKSCHGLGNWYLQAGDHHYAFSITSHASGWRNGQRFGVQGREPLLVAVAPLEARGASLPPSMSFLDLQPANVVLSTLKRQEDGDGIVARVYDTEGRSARATLRLCAPVGRAWHTDILERNARSMAAGGRAVKVPVGHHAIETMKLRPARGSVRDAGQGGRHG